LSALAEGALVTFDPRTDFAVLCPTCHRVIHRLEDVGDLPALRALIMGNRSEE
jgi:5-methylcytosine-specific restriction protein A